MKKFLLAAICAMSVVGVASCADDDMIGHQFIKNSKYFNNEVVEKIQSQEYILRDIDTNVLYYAVTGKYGSGITPILNPDGTPKLYEKEY